MPLQNSPAAVTPPIGYALRSSPPTPLTLLQPGPYNWNASWALREKYIVPVRWQDGYERVQTADKSPNFGGQLFMPEATPRVISRYSVHFEIFLRQYPISGIWQVQYPPHLWWFWIDLGFITDRSAIHLILSVADPDLCCYGPFWAHQDKLDQIHCRPFCNSFLTIFTPKKYW